MSGISLYNKYICYTHDLQRFQRVQTIDLPCNTDSHDELIDVQTLHKKIKDNYLRIIITQTSHTSGDYNFFYSKYIISTVDIRKKFT